MKRKSLIKIFFLILFVAPLLIMTRISSAQDARVTSVFLKADDAHPGGPCPITVNFSGYIKTAGPGTVKYTFTRSDGATAPAFSLDFKEAGTQSVSTTWTLGDAAALPTYEGWQAIKILSPNEFESDHDEGRFVVTCAGTTAASGSTKKTIDENEELRPQISKGETLEKGESAATLSPKSDAAFEKFPGRKADGVRTPKNVPAAKRPAVINLEPIPTVAVTEFGRIKTTKVGDKNPKVTDVVINVNPSAAQTAQRVADPRSHGPNLSNTAGTSTDPDLAAAGDNVYVVWTDSTDGNGEIMLAISTDHGASFWPPVNLSNTLTPSRDPHIAASGRNVYVIWIEDTVSPTGVFTISTDAGDSFSTPSKLDTNAGDTSDLTIAADGGRGYAAWRKVEERLTIFHTAAPSQESVMFCALDDHKTTSVVQVPWHVQDVDVAAGGRNVYVTWSANWQGRDLDPYFSTSTNGGVSFRVNQYDDQASPRGDYDSQWGGGLAASGDTVIWYYESDRGASHNVRFWTSRVAGQGISSNNHDYYALNSLVYNRASKAYRAEMLPHFALDGPGRFVGAWLVARPRSNGLELELHYWESGQSESTISNGNPGEPRVAVNDGSSSVVYTNTTEGAQSDVFAVLTGRGRAFNVSANKGNSIQPRVAASGPNYVVVWTDDTPGNSEIFFHAVPAR